MYKEWETSLTSEYTNHLPNPQWPPQFCVLQVPATCCFFRHITLRFSLYCFIPIRSTIAAFTQKYLGKHNTWHIRENLLLEIGVEEDDIELGIPLKRWGHQIHRFASDTSSKKKKEKKRCSSRDMRNIYQETNQHIHPWKLWSSKFLMVICPAQKMFSHLNLRGLRRMTVNMLRKAAEWIEPLLLPSALTRQKTAINKSQRC